MNYRFNWQVIFDDWDRLLWGLALGLEIAAGAILIGLVIGLVLAFASRARQFWIRAVVKVYVAFLRNQPPLLLLFFAYFVLPRMGIRIDRVESVVLALGLYAGAQLTEVFRASLVNVPKGIREAGLAIGLTPIGTNMTIVLPVMFRNAIPALGNSFISLFKDTSLAAGIAVAELTWQARKISTDTFAVLESWIAACVIYVIVCLVIAQLLLALERWLKIP